MARHECIEEWDLIRAGLKVPKGTWIIDLDTGVIGMAGGFHGERSFNGNPIHFQTLEEYDAEHRIINFRSGVAKS